MEVLDRFRVLLCELPGQSNLFLVLESHLTVAGEVLDVDGGVVDSHLHQEVRSDVQVSFGAAGVHMAPVRVGGDVVDHRCCEPTGHPLPRRVDTAVAQRVVDGDA